ncbi:hypothetical protein BDR26DRAFT_934723 [Obelidium mucronatum]|nr:hypothetical protein BDR26DRAFT_934723 [Obelidium mucronatum]
MLASVSPTAPNTATESCKALFESQKPRGIQISPANIETFLDTLPLEEYGLAATDNPFALPLKFDSIVSELDVLGLTCALNFGSSFRSDLKASLGRGPFDCVRFGVMSMYISEGGGGQSMTASGLKDLSLSDISSLFDIPISKEVQHPTMQFVTMSEHHALRPFAEHIKTVLNEIGTVLERNGYSSLGAFIVKSCKKTASVSASVDELVECLVGAFPCFKDVGLVDGQEVLLFTKAQRLAYFVHIKFPTLLTMPIPCSLNLGADPATVATLISKQIIEIPQELQDKLNSRFDFGATSTVDAKEQECVLRASGAAAVSFILAAAEARESLKGKLDAMGLSLYLRSLSGGSEALRLENKQTVLY